MPDKNWLIDIADTAKQECRQQLLQTIDGAMEDLLEAELEPGTITEVLLQLADDHIDNVINEIVRNSISTQFY